MIKFKPKSEKRKEIVREIKKLRNVDGTYEEIADYFNNIEYFTITGGKWYTQSLHRFYKKHK